MFNSFPVIRTASAKNSHFYVPPPTFLFSLKTPLRLSRNVSHGWKDNSMLSERLAASIFNIFRVIRCLTKCVNSKIAIKTTFLFPLGTPLGKSRQILYGWKENSMLTNCLAACAHVTITVSEIQRNICEKIVILSYPLAFDAPVRGFPSEYRHPL